MLGDQLQRLGFSGTGGPSYQTVPVDSGQRNANLCSWVRLAIDHDAAQLKRLTVHVVAGCDPLRRPHLPVGPIGTHRCRAPFSQWFRRAVGESITLLCRGQAGCEPGVGLSLSAVREELVWIDCEMTGLDLGSDKLIEIAALVTDADLNILGDGVDVVIHADDAALSSMVDVVADMHSRSG